MEVYIVTYDLVNEDCSKKYVKLIGLIQEDGIWARLGGSSYLIQSDLTAVQLRDRYKSVLDDNDVLFVGRVTAPAAWCGYGRDVSNWIIDKLKKDRYE